MDKELFPLRIVTGKRFCNRNQERKLLAEYIAQTRPVVLISPRRYGKSSLAHKVTEELKYPLCSIDFLTAYDDVSICNGIVLSVSKLLSEIMPINMKTIQLLEKCFHGIKAAIRYKFIELKFSSPIEKTDPIRQVFELLQGLDKLAAKLNKLVVVFMDEFQLILETEKGKAIQGSIRNVAQTTKNIAFLFSGSSRHMLSKAFDDPNQPLYMMCEKMFLERIATKHYIPYIQKAAKIKWSKELELFVVNRIIELSENHPFYVNYLCSKLWRHAEPPLDKLDVDNDWEECCISEERRLVEELDKLTINQRILLKEIACTPFLKEPTASAFLYKLKMSSGTVVPMLKALHKKDMIYVTKDKYTKVLDPLLGYFLIKTTNC